MLTFAEKQVIPKMKCTRLPSPHAIIRTIKNTTG